MLGLGWTEMLVIGVMALIFIGPKDLPVVMNRVGKIIGQVRRMGTEFQREINKTTGLDEVRNLRNSITSPLKKSADEIRKEFNAMTPSGAKPSGVIKPADPAAESVVDEIRAKAGMTTPAAPKTADETARAAGFKPAGPAPTASTATATKPVAVTGKKAPVKATKAPARAKAVPTSKVDTAELTPVVAKPGAVTTTAPAAEKQAAAPKPAAARPARAKAAQTKPVETASAAPAKPATTKRAAAKPKSATPKTADTAGDN